MDEQILLPCTPYGHCPIFRTFMYRIRVTHFWQKFLLGTLWLFWVIATLESGNQLALSFSILLNLKCYKTPQRRADKASKG